MAFNLEALIWYILLVDSVFANIFAFFSNKWYSKKYKKFSNIFPMTKGWAVLYLALVLWLGFTLYRLGVLPWNN